MHSISILGAGIAGISAAYHLSQLGKTSTIFEQDSNWGGLCDNFTVDGFRFDKFIHLSFTTDSYVQDLFRKSAEYKVHLPDPVNYYQGHWLKHPAQNNTFPLPVEEKVRIIRDFIQKKEIDISRIENYEQWLRTQFGDYFAEHFPLVYTKKYWTLSAAELETKWVGNRIYRPSLEEVLEGALSPDTPNTYYAKEMRYPLQGGYKSFLNYMAQDLDIQLNHEVTKIDPDTRLLRFADGKTVSYDHLISSLPLPVICRLLKNVPAAVSEAAQKLRWTSGVLVSLGFNRPDIPRNLWFYIYDQEIQASRIYSPSLKSLDNVPAGYSSLQAELYYPPHQLQNLDLPGLLTRSINQFIEMGLFKPDDLIVKDIRTINFANVIFDHQIYENRKIVRDYLAELGITSIGRFGEWAYFWSDQSLLSGKRGAEKYAEEH